MSKYTSGNHVMEYGDKVIFLIGLASYMHYVGRDNNSNRTAVSIAQICCTECSSYIHQYVVAGHTPWVSKTREIVDHTFSRCVVRYIQPSITHSLNLRQESLPVRETAEECCVQILTNRLECEFICRRERHCCYAVNIRPASTSALISLPQRTVSVEWQ